MKKYIRLLIIFVLFLSALYWTYLSYYPTTQEHVHSHAGFRVYIDGTLQNYADYKYMNFIPCSEHDEKKSKEEEQIEKAHLHDSVGDVVHVHRTGSVWGDLFKNIHVKLDGELTGYINGQQVADIMQAEITPYSTAIFLIGNSDLELGKEIIEIEHIKQIESKSELCGANE